MANGQRLTLTARAIAFGAFVAIALLTAAEIALHAAFTFTGVDDGGVIKDLLIITVGSLTTAFGAVVGTLFGNSTTPQ